MNRIHKHVVHYLRVRHFWQFLIRAAFGAVVSATAAYFNLPDWIYWAVAGLLALDFLIGGLARPSVYYRVTRYVLREEVLIVRTGFFRISLKMIPIRRIQGAVLSTGPVSRRYDLANLTVKTASTVFHMPPLKTCEAERLKLEIIEMVKGEQTDV